MPQPTQSDVHVDAILTNMSVAYMQEAYAFVASRAFPQINVQQAMDKLHAELDGKMIYGFEVSYHAWRLVGKGRWVAPLNWQWLQPMWRSCYKLFARYRHYAKFDFA